MTQADLTHFTDTHLEAKQPSDVQCTVLVVANQDDFHQIQSQIRDLDEPVHVIHADDYLVAIGQLGQSDPTDAAPLDPPQHGTPDTPDTPDTPTSAQEDTTPVSQGTLMATGCHHLPVDVLIGDIRLLKDDTRATADALHFASPTARLLILSPVEYENQARNLIIESGFDDYLVGPMSQPVLARALGLAQRPVRQGPATGQYHHVSSNPLLPASLGGEPGDKSTWGQDDETIDLNMQSLIAGQADDMPTANAPPDVPPDAPPDMPLDVPAMSAPTSESQGGGRQDISLLSTLSTLGSASKHSTGLADRPCRPTTGGTLVLPEVFRQSLGDIDLVGHLMSTQPDILPLLMNMIRQHSSIADIQITQKSEDVPPNSSFVPVIHQGQSFGHLFTETHAQIAQLAPWADWAAHWLAMQHHVAQLWHLALHDELTGLWNRRYLMQFLDALLLRAGAQRFRVTVMVFDIDDFKLYNDQFGHGAGDDILRESAKLMVSAVRKQDIVARIGGDEFAVVFWDDQEPRKPNSQHPETIKLAAKRFQKAICEHQFPKLADEAQGTLTISGGLAGFPWDGQTGIALLTKADEMALQSKRQGKNVITFGQGAQKVCEL